jgi:hypothetical protein
VLARAPHHGTDRSVCGVGLKDINSNFLFTALLFFIDLGSQVLYMNN